MRWLAGGMLVLCFAVASAMAAPKQQPPAPRQDKQQTVRAPALATQPSSCTVDGRIRPCSGGGGM